MTLAEFYHAMYHKEGDWPEGEDKVYVDYFMANDAYCFFDYMSHRIWIHTFAELYRFLECNIWR